MEKISIIVPVYNEELYIRQCIESIINQTYKSLEIIIIDDGSVDQSLNICNELSLKDNRIRLISQNNSGASMARNHGLDIATGEFVFFLDGDDVIHPFLIEKLLWVMKKYDTDLSMCDCRKVDNCQMEKLINEVPKNKNRYQCLIGDEIESKEWFHIKYTNKLGSIGGKMILRKSIESIRFEKGLIYGEDTLFLYNLICKGIRIVYFNLEWYYYRQHIKSVTHSDSLKMKEKYLECTKIIRDSEYNKKNILFALRWEGWLIEKMENSLFLMKKEKKKERWKNFRKIILRERKHPLFHLLGLNEKLLFWSCLFCPPLYKVQKQGLINYLWEIIRLWFCRKRHFMCFL